MKQDKFLATYAAALRDLDKIWSSGIHDYLAHDHPDTLADIRREHNAIDVTWTARDWNEFYHSVRRWKFLCQKAIRIRNVENKIICGQNIQQQNVIERHVAMVA